MEHIFNFVICAWIPCVAFPLERTIERPERYLGDGALELNERIENNQLKKQLDELQQEASKLKEDLDCVAKNSVQIAAESQVHYEFARQAKSTSKSIVTVD